MSSAWDPNMELQSFDPEPQDLAVSWGLSIEPISQASCASISLCSFMTLLISLPENFHVVGAVYIGSLLILPTRWF